jgi:hypothetical protein
MAQRLIPNLIDSMHSNFSFSNIFILTVMGARKSRHARAGWMVSKKGVGHRMAGSAICVASQQKGTPQKTHVWRVGSLARQIGGQPTVIRSSGDQSAAGAASGPCADFTAAVLIGSTRSQCRRLKSVRPFSAMTVFIRFWQCEHRVVSNNGIRLRPWNKSSITAFT